MLKRLPLAFLLIAFAMSPALPHGPTPHEVKENIVIAASPDAVWAVLGDFAHMAAWHPLVKASTKTGGDEPGVERTVTLSGGQIVDSLDDYEGARRSYSYRLVKENVEAFPVSFYTAAVTVQPDGEGHSEVVWTGRFYRGYPNNDPPENLNDEAATSAMEHFFRTGLESLKKKLEAR
jgi:mxaD protein